MLPNLVSVRENVQICDRHKAAEERQTGRGGYILTTDRFGNRDFRARIFVRVSRILVKLALLQEQKEIPWKPLLILHFRRRPRASG